MQKGDKLLTTSDVILERLLGLHPKSIDLVLDRIERLLNQLGSPHTTLPPIIHVAGTNGKGSTIAFMRAILEAGGLRVHSYTSPHLVRFHERIRLAGPRGEPSAPISEALLSGILDECERVNNGQPITFFEITTAAAMLAFARHEADIVLLEVGLGGRYDATNIIKRPAVSVITHIDHDHHDFLGDDIIGIAGEKAGIIKHKVPVIVGSQYEAVKAALKDQAKRLRAPLIAYGEDFFSYEEAGRLVYQDTAGVTDLPLPRLKGRHQYENAALAITALRQMPDLTLIPEAYEHGIQNAAWPARCQALQIDQFHDIDWPGEPPEIWLDGGHNANAGEALAATMAELGEHTNRPLYLVVGMMANKDVTAFLDPFHTIAAQVFAVPIPDQPNGANPDDVAQAAQDLGINAETSPDVMKALHEINDRRQAIDTRSPRILICGSLYLAGSVLSGL